MDTIVDGIALNKIVFQNLTCPDLCAAAHNNGYVELAIM
jgi:hypothetical protein